MPEIDRQCATEPGARQGARNARLERVPLVARMLVYGLFFLAAVVGGLPYLAHQLDVRLPTVHREIGLLRTVGAALLVICLLIYVRSSYVLSRRGRGAYVEFDPPREFVAVGPYRWVRNPIAACVVGMLLGEALAFSSTGIFLLFLAALLLAHGQVVLLEEPLLRKRFGQPYIDYLARVPRWLPRPPRKASA